MQTQTQTDKQTSGQVDPKCVNVKELHRQHNNDGQTIVQIETGKLMVRLINTYDKKSTLDEMLYMIACRRLADRI